MSQLRKDSSLGALTPEGIEFVLFPAGLPIRTLAYSIDKFAQWIILLAIWLSSHALKNAFGIWLMLILNFCVDWFYHVIWDMVFRGQSPGKRLMGIRVVRSDGAPVDAASSFLRNLLRFADTFFFLCPIALISMAASPGFRRLGDWAGGTLVVYTAKVAGISRQPAGFWLANQAPIVPVYPLSHEEKQAILMFARRYPLLGEARANEIACPFAQQLRGAAGTDESLSDAAYLLGIARKLSGETP
ncbi:RDD family protein [Spirochaetia bacterium]|nr:RDD family protein [Spirochaetia bacterium]